MKFRYIRRIILFALPTVLLFIISLNSSVFGAILDDWKDPSVYKPNPILFLHGFGPGSPDSWNYIKSELSQYFNNYSSTLNFLETINFNDPNGSVDTYLDGRKGWADKVKDRVDRLLNIYRFKGSTLKINLICHSMGGLAAREYVTNSKYSTGYLNIDELITIATPHAGSPFAHIKKIEDATTGMHKYVWDIPTNERVGIKINNLELTDSVLQLLRGKFHIDPEGEAVKDMAVKSKFLMNLNSRNQPTGFKNYALYGETWHFLNALFSVYYPSEPWTCGDGIVPRDSQIGIDIMTNYPDTTPRRVWSFDGITKIPVDHFTELNYEETPQKILSFLDSTPPELEITYPGPGTTEIYETSIHIQGRVYKEYLPADTELTISVTRQEDGYTLLPQTSFLKPSNLWIPNNPDSPVAEFDEEVNFPGQGTYQVSLQAKNPAGETSDIKDVWVRVLMYGSANIIVHCHNPEGKEIASIQGMDPYCVQIYDGNTLIGYGAYNAQTHNKPIEISSGSHTIKAIFNGRELSQNINLQERETKIITFIFEREKFDLLENFLRFNCHIVSQINGSFDGIGKDLDTDSCNNSNWRTETLHDWCHSQTYGTYSLYAELLFNLSNNNLEWKIKLDAYKTTCWRIPPYPLNCSWHTACIMPPINDNLELYLQNYDNWFLQYMDCTIQKDFLIKISDVSLIETDCQLRIIPQGIVPIYIENKNLSSVALHGGNCNMEQYSDNCWRHWGSYLKEGTGQIKVWLSSVPYDLLGTGVN